MAARKQVTKRALAPFVSAWVQPFSISNQLEPAAVCSRDKMTQQVVVVQEKRHSGAYVPHILGPSLRLRTTSSKTL
jgi:hypothetical protein